MWGIGRHLTFANVMSCVAVFIALGGTSYAALKVSGKNVKDGSLTGRDLKNGSVGSADVKNRSLLARDFKSGQLPAGARGPAGATGATGAQGPPGPTMLAQVSLGGALVSGTAASASRTSAGVYTVRFPRNVAKCAGAASAASFPGSGGNFFRISALLEIGASDPSTVVVNLFDTSGAGAATDSAFTLILACP